MQSSANYASTDHSDAPRRGRGGGQFRGRGRGRGGRGRGRGGPDPGQSSSSSSQNINSNARGTSWNRGGHRPRDVNRDARQERPRLTHFLALPLGHLPALRERVTAFTSALLASNPSIPGLDTSVVIPARRLHLTLGVMSLADSTGPSDAPADNEPRPKTLSSAITLLNELRPRVMDLLGNSELRVALRRVDVMRPDRGDIERAHVMWVGPYPDDEDTVKLKRVAEFINKEFREAGLVVDEKRPLKLHCTVLNTIYRKPKSNQRLPFSYAAVLDSPAFAAIEVAETDATAFGGSIIVRGKRPISVNLGDWVIEEVQICEMGSWGPEGEYVCVGRIPLTR